MAQSGKFEEFLEQRRFERVVPSPTAPVEVQIMGPGFLEIVHATDISVGGVGVFVPHGVEERAIDHPVDIILTLPHRRPVHLRGIIRNVGSGSTHCRVGVQFTQLPDKVQDAIQRYVVRHSHRPYMPPSEDR